MADARSSSAVWHLATFIVLAFLTTYPSQANTFDLSYGGRLAGPAGEPLAGPVDLIFRFYRDPSGGSVLVTVSLPSVPLVDGVFQVELPISPADSKLLFDDGDKTVFVEMESQGKVYPRQKFGYVPLALRVPVDGTKIVYDSQGRLTLGPGTTTGPLPGISGTGVVEKTGDQSYTTFPLSPAGKSLMGAATSAEQRTALGLGTMAQKNSISPGDLSSSTCADGTVLRKGPSGWGCETLGPADLSSLVSQTEFDYLAGVTSSIQTQLNNRLSSAGGSLSGSLTLNQGSELRLATTNAGVSAGFKAPAHLPTNTIYTLPSGFGSDGQVLTSSSTGLLSWTTIPVTAVNGQIGNVSLNADSIDETASRKYYSHTLARQALSSTGLLSYNSSTGVMSLSDTLLTKSGGTMTGSLDFAGTLKVTNLADPTADGDAAKKAYVDGKLGGQPLVVGTPSPGQVIKWDGSKFALATDAVGVAGGGIASLNTLTAGSQSLAVETPGVTTGTRPSWTADSGTSTHTLTIPMAGASGVTAGLISKTDYDVFSSKQEGITLSSTIALGSLSTNFQNALDLKPYGTSAGQTGEMRFRELNASGMNYVGLKSPDNLVTNTIWTLPAQDGASGYVLSTDGSGSLSWISHTTGSVTSIATGTGLSGGPISGVGTISLTNVGTAGTYTKVTTNAQGQVISGANLADTDIPNLPASKITSGILAVEQGGSGAATAQPFSVLAGPSIGPTAGAPSFRTLVPADIPSLDASKITSGTLSSALINWAAAPVTTVAGRTGAVTLLSSDISGLGSLATVNVVSGGSGGTITDGTITNDDISASAAIAQSKVANLTTDLAAKEGTIAAGTTVQYYRGDKSWQTLNTTAVTEGASLYFTNTRARQASSATAPLAYDTSTGVMSMAQASTVANGFLSSADFTSFNNKQAAITSASVINVGTLTTALQNGVEINAYGASAGNTGELRFEELAANGANYVGFKSPDNLAANIIWTLPSVIGSSGQVLSTGASGVLSWITPPSAPVTTVAGRTGAVTLANTDISGLGSLATVNAVSGGTGGSITDDSITNADISSSAGIADSKLATIATPGKVANSATTAASTNTVNAIVSRDGSGNFSAGTITATLNGNATNVTGTVAIANGGTGASSVSAARAALGLGTAATLNVGSAANNVVQLDGSAKLPAIDGSQLTGVVSTDSTKLPLAGGTLTGALNLPANGLVAGANQLVLSGGNVGIGTTAPLLTAHVHGVDGAESGSATPSGSLMVGGQTAGTPTAMALTMGVVGGGSNYSWLQSRNRSSAAFYFLALNPSGGNVGIGTTNPTATLQVAGSIAVSGGYFQAGCPSGTTLRATNLCMDDTDRASTTFEEGQATCRSIGAHMCTYSEVYSAWPHGAVVGNFLGNRVADDVVLYISGNTNRANFENDTNKAGPRSYRCCFGPFTP